jgi:hypothetical protein
MSRPLPSPRLSSRCRRLAPRSSQIIKSRCDQPAGRIDDPGGRGEADAEASKGEEIVESEQSDPAPGE